MPEISYIDAWGLWFSGKNVADQMLLGIQILWWGRLGKIVGLLSALSIIAEIIGPQKLRKFGKSLHGIFSLRDVDDWGRVLISALG